MSVDFTKVIPVMPLVSRPESIPVAIIGMGCRLPGADDLDAYWKLIIEGRSAVREMPADRMDQSLYFDPEKGVRGKTYSKLAATLSSREFDRQSCPLPEELIRGVDNVHLLMCGVAADALRHAGLDPFALPDALRNAGVYIGHAQGSEFGCDTTYATCVGEAAEFLREVPELQNLPRAEQDELVRALVSEVRGRLPQRTSDAPDVSASMVAGTISHAFGLSGPFLAINSACASSLQAMLLGVRALQLGQIDMAVVGGASDCKGDTLVLFSHAQAMSASDSRPFDANADGLIVGEGYAAVVLKRLDRALADGDRVLAVVRGLGVSSDGKGKSLWAPRKEGQTLAMQRAYRDGVDMSRLQYIEAHSTATQLGDATELNTLAEVLTPQFPPGHKIPVTSVKANIGHTLETAGLAGVIKTVLCMQHGIVPPAINIASLNPNIDWKQAPVFVPTSAIPWPAPEDGHPRRAGINAFGIGGLNMHVVLDEFTESARNLIRPPASPVRSATRIKDEDAIAVIGRGCIFSGAANLQDFWRLLQSGEDARRPVPLDRWRSDLIPLPNRRTSSTTSEPVGGFITGYAHDWRRHKIPPKQIQQADPLQFMLLDAMDEAFAEAGYDQMDFDRLRAGVVVGTEFGGDFAFQLQLGLRLPELQRIIVRHLKERGWSEQQSAAVSERYAAVLLGHWPALIDETGSFSTSTLASRLGKTWNLMGGAAAIDAGDASSLAALAVAIDLLRAGDCDLMVCAGAQRRMGLPEYEALSLKGLLPMGEPRSPLDAAYDGYVPGEGVGVLLLKRLADARRDGDPIHSIIRGVAAAHAHEPCQAMRLAMHRSFHSGGLCPEAISAIELDATGSRSTIERQLTAIAQVHEATPRQRPVWVSSVASQIGHTQGAAGVASLLKASLQIEQGEILPAHGVEHP
ncbi:MAG: polyketide synthase, partial [Planctomycetaceae bacterium]|nr:polyketide synthase [Planctomycetaceae bacterium]